jgi:hypothetical protein
VLPGGAQGFGTLSAFEAVCAMARDATQIAINETIRNFTALVVAARGTALSGFLD